MRNLEKIKLSASNYFHKIIRMISFPNSTQPISVENKVHLSTMLYNTLNSETVPPKVKKNLQEAFGNFLCDDHGSFHLKKFIIHFFRQFIEKQTNC